MPDAQIADRLSPRHTVRPRCPQCQARMEVQHVAPGRLGFEHWTLSNINFDDAALIAASITQSASRGPRCLLVSSPET